MAKNHYNETIYSYKGGKWPKLAFALSLLCLIAYIFYRPEWGHNGGTWLGYPLGGLGFGLIVWLAWFGVKKRRYNAGNWLLKGWLSAHVWLGLSLLIVGTLHTGFEFGWNVHTLAYVLMVIVILSGIYGIWAYGRYPDLMTRNRNGQTLPLLLAEIAALDSEAMEASLQLPDAYADLVRKSQSDTLIGGSLWQQLTASDKNCATKSALLQVATLGEKAEAGQGEAITRLRIALSRKKDIVMRARHDIAFKARMDVWLYLHVPLSIALIGALLAHVIAVFFYW